MSSSLVIQTSFLGDAVLTTPLVRELAARGPVDIVVTPAAAPLLAGSPHLRSVFAYDKRARDAGPGGVLRLARRIRTHVRGHGDNPGAVTAYLAQGSMRSAALALLAGARERVGFDRSAGRALYTRRVPHPSDRHHVERLWRLAFFALPAIEPTGDALRPAVYPGPAERAAVDALLNDVDARPLVALAPGSVWATKRWPYYGELAARLAPHARLAIVGGPDDTALAREIAAATGDAGTVDAAGRLSLLASAELISRAAILVTNDSLPQHLASAVGTPTITIFGPTVPAFGFGPLAPRSRTLGHAALDCRPCHHHGPAACPLGHWRCMRELDPAAVMQAVLDLLPR